MFSVFWRGNRRPSQIAMLLAATASGIVAVWFFNSFVTTAPMAVITRVMRWGLGEFLWCWMAADHCFTTIGRLRKTGQLHDLRQTPLAPGEITRPLIKATSLYLGAGILVWFVADVLTPWPPPFLLLFDREPSLEFMWRFGFPLVMAMSHFATACMASAWCTRAVLEPGESDIWNWLGALVYMGAAMAGMLIVMLGLYVGLTAVFSLTSYRDFVYLAFFSPLYRNEGMIVSLGILLAVTLPAKFLIARINARRAEALLLDERNI